MDRDGFIQTLGRFVGNDLVLKYSSESPTEYLYEIEIDGRKEPRSQLVRVFLDDQEGENLDVIAYSVIGHYPNDIEALLDLLRENKDGYYSKLCVLENDLVQLYRYPIGEAEYEEMLKGIYEVARFADYYEYKYYGGIDRT